MYETVRNRIIEKYGSINKLSKIIGMEPQDLYSAFNGKRPFFPKWKKRVAEALDMDVNELFPEEESND